MPQFRIANYQVQHILRRFGEGGGSGGTRRERMLVLKSVTMFHGIVVTARLAFSTSFDSWSGGPAGFMGGLDTFAPQITGWYPLADFAPAYDMLRNEKPLFLEYDFRAGDETAAGRYLERLVIRSEAEPLGEGAPDASAAGLAISIEPRLPSDIGSTIKSAPDALPPDFLEEPTGQKQP